MLKYIICCLTVFLLVSCSESTPDKPKSSVLKELVIRDELGRELRIQQPVRRILPLCASSAETLVLLCDSSQLIGHTPECSSPAWLLRTPVINNYPVDIEKVVTLKPDLIVSKEGMMSNDHLTKLEALGLTVYMQRADDIKGIAYSMEALGVAMGQGEKGRRAAARFQASFDSLQRASFLHDITRTAPKPTAIGIISSDPVYVFGYSSYLTDVLSYCGLSNAIDSTISQAFPVVDQEYLLKEDPNYLIFPGEGNQLEELVTKFPALKKLSAYRHNHCIQIPGDWLSRPGPQLIRAALLIHQQTQPRHEKR